ncbi:hypothetical protein [Ketobacter alkanivorans]|uniref:MotA/TolQ/ExbB proton channel domain-containing protein n=1 Tax=Ketobacter alkanivorans TaxID=1917421 RepID=A0A2K9LLV8_9GAMM|nr:hypothetical protein [Ketobacter alkanivorans]AUM13161.1 hypothetical protein Kalk_12310 [Ketobacter alkanivorans]
MSVKVNVQRQDLAGWLIRPGRVLFYLGGTIVIALALASYLTETDTEQVLLWLRQVFTSSFIVMFLVLVFAGVYGLIRLDGSEEDAFWRECTLQAANGIATLALTFTLLGISLGIGGLAQHSISVDTVPGLIQELTGHFSTAFMTTVVGLPVATLLRSVASIRSIRLQLDWRRNR